MVPDHEVGGIEMIDEKRPGDGQQYGKLVMR